MALLLPLIKKARNKQHYKKPLSIIPYFFTFANAFFGFLSVVFAMQHNSSMAAYCIVLAACMDACDGRLARFLGSCSGLGAELDALCDAISFCFAPVIMIYALGNFSMNYISLIISSCYLCGGLFRLARFNSYHTTSTDFCGLPTTAAAFFLACIVKYYDWIKTSYFSFVVEPFSLLCLLVLLTVLMISSLNFSSFKRCNVNEDKIVVQLSIIFFGIIFGCLWYQIPLLLCTISVYIVSSIISSILFPNS